MRSQKQVINPPQQADVSALAGGNSPTGWSGLTCIEGCQKKLAAGQWRNGQNALARQAMLHRGREYLPVVPLPCRMRQYLEA